MFAKKVPLFTVSSSQNNTEKVNSSIDITFKTMGKRPARDPGAPKRNMSAYLLYQNAMREQFKALNPGMTFGQLAKYTSAMYSELPPSEKEAWVARAEADKACYLHELASYVPPPGYDAKGDAIVFPVNTKSCRKGKPEKDINAPKRNMSAYLLYQNAMREQFKRENPGMTFGQLAKYTSHMYKNLTPDEKATWEARAAQDKARYDTEIAGYVPPPGHDARGVLIEDHCPRKRNKRGLVGRGSFCCWQSSVSLSMCSSISFCQKPKDGRWKTCRCTLPKLRAINRFWKQKPESFESDKNNNKQTTVSK